MSDDGKFTPRYWKRVAYSFFCVMFALSIIWPLELAYSPAFGRNVLMYVAMVKLSQPLLEKLCLHVLGEYLLLAPCIVVFNWVQMIMILGADTFIMQISCYFLLIVIGTAQRLWLNPFLSTHWDEISSRLQDMLVRVGARQPDEDEIDRRVEKEKQQQKREQAHTEGNIHKLQERTSAELLEPLFEAMTTVSSESVAQLLGPLVFWVLRMFVAETHITRSFDVADRHIDYYIIFTVLTVAACRVTDVIQLNLLEAVCGWKVFDFLKYMQFRFEHRYQVWKADEVNPDSNLPHSMHSIDKLCFSSQYYIMITLSCTISSQ
jgi:hypothetical protein